MNYQEAVRFLYDLQLFGAKFGLENTRRLAGLAGNPQEKLRFIHVAGTNGKGSVCAMLESIYRTAGYRTGLYTSPHLVHFGERIRINNLPVDSARVVRLVEHMQGLLSQGAQQGFWPEIGSVAAEHRGHPTFFEVVTVMALICFAEEECDIVLWETGMGGRLDATNIVTPLASVITNISLEHSDHLGDTIEKIAAEKCGIIKPHVSVVTGCSNESALKVIREVARSRGSDVTTLEETTTAEAFGTMFGDTYQRSNALLASAVVEVLQHPLPVRPEQLRQGLESFSMPGRLHRIQRGPQTFLIDGAHNPAGLCALRDSLAPITFTTIFGCFADKRLAPSLQELLPLVSELHLVPVDSPRSAAPAALEAVVREQCPELAVTTHGSLTAALEALRSEKQVLITGSLHLVGEALAILEKETSGERALNDWRVSTR